jgi:phage terminase large subunit-like protein
MRTRLDTFRNDPVAFIDDIVQRNEHGKAFALIEHQKTILRSAFRFDDDGNLPYNTIVYSCPKKSGKTTINAAVTVWWAFTHPSDEIFIVANDFDQAQGRVFKAIVGLIKNNPELARAAKIQSRQISLSNGTVITVLPAEYTGAAGSNHGFTSWDEVWGYTSESAIRLWEEMTPVPTRKNSIRFITTYAGWENESTLLRTLYKRAVGTDEDPEGQGTRLHPGLPIYANEAARLFCYWDHEPRMPWQDAKYYDGQRQTLRASNYLRLHENRWVTTETAFITPEMWDACIDSERRPLMATRQMPIYVGVDVATKHDCSSVVAVYYEANALVLGLHRIWTPTATDPVNIEATVEAYLRDLNARYRVQSIVVDPFQMVRSIETLKREGLRIRELPQTSATTTQMGQILFEQLNGRTLRLYPAADLRAQALNTVAVESSRGWRIAKESTNKKIDAIVALSMACMVAIEEPPRQSGLRLQVVARRVPVPDALMRRRSLERNPYLVKNPRGEFEYYRDPRFDD